MAPRNGSLVCHSTLTHTPSHPTLTLTEKEYVAVAGDRLKPLKELEQADISGFSRVNTYTGDLEDSGELWMDSPTDAIKSRKRARDYDADEEATDEDDIEIIQHRKRRSMYA